MGAEASTEGLRRLADLAGRPGGTGGGPEGADGMSLASARPGGAPGGRLAHDDRPWTSAAGVAVELRTSVDSGVRRLKSAHGGVEARTEGLASTAVLTGVLDSWQRRLTAASAECGRLDGALRAVAKDQGENEARTRAAFRRAGKKPEPGAGGR